MGDCPASKKEQEKRRVRIDQRASPEKSSIHTTTGPWNPDPGKVDDATRRPNAVQQLAAPGLSVRNRCRQWPVLETRVSRQLDEGDHRTATLSARWTRLFIRAQHAGPRTKFSAVRGKKSEQDALKRPTPRGPDKTVCEVSCLPW